MGRGFVDNRPLRRGNAAYMAWTAAGMSLGLIPTPAHTMQAPLPQLRDQAGYPQNHSLCCYC